MITSREAKLHTFSVTIQSLTVKDKQMTLAVFRQLPQGRFYEDTNGQYGPIPGTPWGVVRYDIKDQGDRWIVQEHNGILYRCVFPENISLWRTEDAVKSLEYKIKELERDAVWSKSSREKIPGVQAELKKVKWSLTCKINFNAGMDILISELNELPQLFIAV